MKPKLLALLVATALLPATALLAGCGSPATAKSTPTHQGPSRPPQGSSQPPPSPPEDTFGLAPDIVARVPHFGPPPPPEPVTIPPGPAAGWFSKIPTTQKIAFITIDDGWSKDPHAEALFKYAHVPITLFLEINAIKMQPDYFKPLVAAGATIEAHTITHQELKGKSYDVQKHEICGSADQLQLDYGVRPTLFRPPFGDKDSTTLRAVHDCGLKAAFFWKETTDKGIIRYQEGHTVQPGDIILMHFRPAFVDDFLAVLNAIHDAGLTPARLENYITT